MEQYLQILRDQLFYQSFNKIYLQALIIVDAKIQNLIQRFSMAQRFGEFFLEPQWPSQNGNIFGLANFSNDSSQQANPCKTQEPTLPLVKFQQMMPEVLNQEEFKQINPQYMQDQSSVFIKQEDDEYDDDDDNYQSQSQYKAKQNSNCKNNSKIQKLFPRLVKKQQIQNKQRKNNKQFIKNPLKKLINQKQKEYERGRYRILSEELKKQIVQECKNMTMVEVSKKYHVSVNNICRWRKRCDRRTGAGRKVTDMQMENKLLQWIFRQNKPIPRKQVQIMARRISGQQSFKASKGWFQRFYKRNKLEYNTNVEILTYNDYRQRVNQQAQPKICNSCKIKSENHYQHIQAQVKLQYHEDDKHIVKIEQPEL